MAANKFVALDERLYAYLVAHGHNQDPLLAELADETARRFGRAAGMQIAPEQGTLLNLLARASGARTAIEVGTFTGYSALCVARALPPDGRLLCCDINREWTALAQSYWARAGVAERITLKLAPALETIRALPAGTSFDFAFIDADKANYRAYYEEILQRSRPGALVLIDNVLWGGEVLNAADRSADTVAIRELNDFVAQDNRVEAVMIAVADGLTICRKK
ncbi:MAG TPA: class I SAM-dependent methyltransferase [Candidatus Binataceae bacterium]|jgi:caffeoyl-CoA O-methyltransferase|nr:class I SAM-dependent methyltransferase [Candidatus Binataceae bacterium]